MERILQTPLSRRNLLRLGAFGSVAVLAEMAGVPVFSRPVQAASDIEPIPIPADTPFIEHDFQFTSLKQWQAYLEPEKQALRDVIYNIDLYKGSTRGLSHEDQINDFELYWEIYRMGERMFWVPAPLLWVMHLGETNASRHKAPDGVDVYDRWGNFAWRANNPNKGAMQLWERHFENPAYQQELENIRTQAGFLADITDLRYIQGQPANGDGSICEQNDWENIPLAAFFILSHTSQYQGYEHLEAMKLVVQRNYSAYRGPSDIYNFVKFKSALQPVLDTVVYTPPKSKPILNNPLAF